MIESEWIKLLVKFKGKCQKCEKQILAGDYALWSKSSKTIIHIDCKNNNNSNTSDESKEKNIGVILCCLLCGNNVEVINPKEFLLNHINQDDSFFLCYECLNNPKSYLKYQGLINEKIKKIVKLKS